MSAAVGTLGKLGIGSTSPVTTMLDFKSDSLRLRQESVNGNGVRGTLSHHHARVRAGLKRISGGLGFQPNSKDFATLLPWILLGSTSNVSGTNNWIKLGNAAVARYVTIDRHAKVFTYTTTGVNSARFTADQGMLLNVDLDCLAATETVANAGTFPSLEADVTTNPFILSDLSLSINGTGSVTAKRFELEINNYLDPDRFFNSLTLSALVALDRMVVFRTQVPYGDWTSFYDMGAGTGVAVVATFTNGTSVLKFTMPKVIFPPVAPVVEGRSEVMLDLEGRAYRTGALSDDTGQELVTELDYGA
jgi:hypothetical protein